MSASSLFKLISSTLKEEANPLQAPPMKAYLKNKFELFGAKGPVQKAVFKKIWNTAKEDILKNWKALVYLLWEAEEREHQYFAMEIIRKVEKKLTIDDLDDVEYWITHKSWWDTVDFLASHAVGSILKDDRFLMESVSARYFKSENLWLMRTAIIFQLFYKHNTHEFLLFALIDDTKGSKEFFINKASGWALRQYSKVNPAAVKEFIESRRSELSNLTIKEGSKYLS